MDFLESIKNFVPSCPQEETDREWMLSFISRFPETVAFRENTIAHLTGTGFVLNGDRSKLLLIYHELFRSFSCPGGHADGETDLLQTALRETEEESGTHPLVLDSHPISLDILAVQSHWKGKNYVNAHLHLNLFYLLQAEEKLPLAVNRGEWIPLKCLEERISEPHMWNIYRKILSNLKWV